MMMIRCIDVETTGLDPRLDRIVEVATVDLRITPVADPVRYMVERARMWSSLVNPCMPVPCVASGVHDIVDEMVVNAPKIGDLKDQIADGAPDYWCAHNSRFDSAFIKPDDKTWLDTYRIALWLWPDAPEHKLATLRYWLKLNLVSPWPESDPSWRARSHTALWDAYVCAAVLRRCFMVGATVEQMVEVSTKPALLPRFRFGKHAGVPIKDIPASYLDWVLCQDGMDEDAKHTAFWELQNRRNVQRLKGEPG
jgi:exodeoxyribonuclease X